MPQARTTATVDAQEKCPFCYKFFKRLNGHWGKSSCGERLAFLQTLQAKPDDANEDAMEPEDEDYNENMQTFESNDFLALEFFPLSPNHRASKRPRPMSPDVFTEAPTATDEIVEEPIPFEADKAFKLYTKHKFPQPKVFATNQPTLFNSFSQQLNTEFPFSPFASAEEWSLVEWLTTSGLSKDSVNRFLKLSWVFFYLFVIIQ
ncbi:MAG TPA: hypothetical protein VGO47_11600 [Chlamydiales bacterium]|nr:hypothetical protein [Chlamydiales bacterium]